MHAAPLCRLLAHPYRRFSPLTAGMLSSGERGLLDCCGRPSLFSWLWACWRTCREATLRRCCLLPCTSLAFSAAASFGILLGASLLWLSGYWSKISSMEVYAAQIWQEVGSVWEADVECLLLSIDVAWDSKA